MLMSPLSVAQYIDPSLPPFDVVVFDEASQLPVEDAIGALARGKQAVIVGDTRQLPPTRFFAGDVEDERGSEELESILSEAVASGLPELRLSWHYRSRHEDLIAFSNERYYEGRLSSFPAADDEDGRLGLRFVHVGGGVYARGSRQTNLREAEALVDEVVRRLCDPEERERSLGIVTFSARQQDLIEDLLDRERAAHPEIERYFSDVNEPVFVKNLETVQGDERDVIFFSVGYGRDESGKLTMNFGPLNRDGGERRLNVAVTRAREQLVVFASIVPQDIDLRRTRQRGPRDLRAFLELAQRGSEGGVSAAVATGSGATGEVTGHGFDSPFEKDVYEALVAHGLPLDAQIGAAGYRIDLAVRDETRPGRYLLGIECDGASYHSARTARDRDRLRAAVLEMLGWRLVRVWSTDWFADRTRSVARLLEAIEEAKEAPRARLSRPANAGSGEGSPASAHGAALGPIEAAPPPVSLPVGRAARYPWSEPFEPPVLPPVTDVARDAFYTSASNRVLARQLAALVEQCAPLTVDAAIHAIQAAWGMGRTGRRIHERIDAAIRRSHDVELAGDTLWAAGCERAAWRGVRLPDDGKSARDANDVPVEELANAAEHLLRDASSMERDDVLRDVAEAFGWHRVGKHVRARVEGALEHLLSKGRAHQGDDGRLRLGDAGVSQR